MFAILFWIAVARTDTSNSLLLYPKPNKVSNGSRVSLVVIQPCSYNFLFGNSTCEDRQCPFYQLVKHYRSKHFKCQNFKANSKFQVQIKCKNTFPQKNFSNQDESFSLSVDKPGNATLQANQYVGIVRAMQTFSQLFQFFGKFKLHAVIRNLPISIIDSPLAEYRGLAIDVAHHFLPIWLLKQTVDGMMYSKLNTLTINFVNHHYLRLRVPGFQALQSPSQKASYTTQHLQQLIVYAMLRGVKIVPKINLFSTTIFSKAESLQPKLASNKMLDPSVSKDIYKSILSYVANLFVDSRINIGQIESNINFQFKNSTLASSFQKLSRIPFYLYIGLANEIIKELGKNVVVQGKLDELVGLHANLPIYQYHYFKQQTIGLLQNVSSLPRLVLSPNSLDLGSGVYNINDKFSEYHVFFRFYQVQSNTFKAPIVGLQSYLYSEIYNEWTHNAKIFMRASAAAESGWTNSDSGTQERTKRLVALQKHMQRRGLAVSPLTCQQCENNIEKCF